MKIALLALALSATAAHAQAVRKCTDEVLTCRIEQELMSGGKVFVKEDSAKFDGFNYDEPSIEPNECVINMGMEHNKILFHVLVGDSDYMANVYAVSTTNLGKLLPGDASFPIVKGKKFYYRNERTIISCVLN